MLDTLPVLSHVACLRMDMQVFSILQPTEVSDVIPNAQLRDG